MRYIEIVYLIVLMSLLGLLIKLINRYTNKYIIRILLIGIICGILITISQFCYAYLMRYLGVTQATFIFDYIIILIDAIVLGYLLKSKTLDDSMWVATILSMLINILIITIISATYYFSKKVIANYSKDRGQE